MGEDFQDEVRRAHDAPALDFISVAQDDQVGLHHGLVVAVQADVYGGNQRDAFAAFFPKISFHL